MKRHVQSGSRSSVSAPEHARTGAGRRSSSDLVEPKFSTGKLSHALWHRADIAWLVFFRIAFGSIMLWEIYRYFSMGRIRRYYTEPTIFFSYFGFDWVKPWPGDGMYIHFVVMGVLALLITIGLFYRVSAFLFFFAFTWAFLIDQSLYLNHFYLVCLISLLMVFVPMNRSASLDAQWGIAPRSQTAPAWTLWLLRAQIGLVYFFGGVAKLNADWLRGEPIREWLAARSSLPLIGRLLAQDWAAWLFAYGGLLFDLLIVPALLWRRTRVWAFIVAVLFHLTNAVVFQIGIFPWFMIAATTVFFDPDWPRRWLDALRGHRGRAALSSARRTTCGPLQRMVGMERRRGEDTMPCPRMVVALWTLYLAVQLLVPLRHWLYAGDASWTEEGHRFSWRMKLRAKSADAQFYVTDAATGQTHAVNPVTYLKPHQFDEMLARPDMLLQFAHHLASEARARGVEQVQVRAFVRASLNGRAPQLLIDPSVNLADVPRTLRSANWIRPLSEPLRRQTSN